MPLELRARLDQMIDKAIPTRPAEPSWLDIQDRPALRLRDTLDTGTVAIIATPTRPVAAQPSMADPVPYNAELYGPMPKLLPTRRALPPLFVYAHIATLFAVVGGFLWFVSAL